MKTRYFSFLFFSLFLIACSDYQKAVRNADYDKKLTQADVMFEKKNYDKAIALYEQVYQRFPKADEGKKAYYQLARSYYEMKDYYMGGYYFSQFTVRFPLDDWAEKAMFYSALCSVKNAPEEHFDQDETEVALNDLQTFIQRYPNSELVDTCNLLMDKLFFRLEKKNYNAVKLYDKTEESRAAVVSAKSFLEEYPRSQFLKEVAAIQIENAYLLALNSIFDKKKERIEDTQSAIAKYRPLFEDKKSMLDKFNKYNENLNQELIKVDEQYEYIEIVRAYEKSNSSSLQKKAQYLKETVIKFNNFAEKYPNSKFYEKAKSYSQKAEKELTNI